MKKFLYTLTAALSLLGMSSCSDKDEPLVNPDNNPAGNTSGVHYDVFLTIGKHGGMNLGDGTIVRTLSSLDASEPTVDIKGTGLEFRAGDNTLSMEAIVKDGYYYQVPNSNDRFVKFTVGENAITVVNEQPFVKNTYKVHSYTHTWLPDNNLLIVAANGAKDKILWTRLNADNLSIIDEGTLDIALPKDAATFTTSGLLSYCEKTGKLYYFYYGKTTGSGMKSTRVGNFHVATLDPATMAVLTDHETPLAEEMTGSAFGELMQNFIAYDETGNLYLTVFSTIDGEEVGKILKINAGADNFDSAYNAFPNPDGKIHTLQYLADGKAIIYVRENALGTKSDAFSKYYAIVDLNTGAREKVKYNGVALPYSSGGFSQRTAIHDGKLYIGVCAEGGNQGIYIYDIKTGEVTKGVDIAPGYYFDILRIVDNK